MPRTDQFARRLGDSPEDARRQLLKAAEVCVDRHGIRKTTMEDIAREAGISRPTVYRYFSDREDLLLAVTANHSRALVQKVHRFLAKQPTFTDAIVEGLLYLADHGRRDVFTRHLVESNDPAFSKRLATSKTHEGLAGEMWGEYLAAAQAKGHMDPTLDLDDVHVWLANLGLMLMSLMDRSPNDKDRQRRIVRRFVPAPFLLADPPGQS